MRQSVPFRHYRRNELHADKCDQRPEHLQLPAPSTGLYTHIFEYYTDRSEDFTSDSRTTEGVAVSSAQKMCREDSHIDHVKVLPPVSSISFPNLTPRIYLILNCCAENLYILNAVGRMQPSSFASQHPLYHARSSPAPIENPLRLELASCIMYTKSACRELLDDDLVEPPLL